MWLTKADEKTKFSFFFWGFHDYKYTGLLWLPKHLHFFFYFNLLLLISTYQLTQYTLSMIRGWSTQTCVRNDRDVSPGWWATARSHAAPADRHPTTTLEHVHLLPFPFLSEIKALLWVTRWTNESGQATATSRISPVCECVPETDICLTIYAGLND